MVILRFPCLDVMHEMSYAEAILENLLNLAEKNNAREIKKAHLVIGELLLINPEQLEFCFRAISRETIAENCTLEIEFVKPEIRCVKCGKEFEVPAGVCECGGFVSVNGGKEMILKSVIMEVD